MLKILNAAQIRAADADVIAHEPISSIALMERACDAFTSWFVAHFSIGKNILVVCGTGNNGGDGLGIARMLKHQGYGVSVWIVRGGTESEDFTINQKRLAEAGIAPLEITGLSEVPAIVGVTIIIDAIFGSGISRPAEGHFAEVIRRINGTDAIRVAVDIPSGMFPDKPTTGIAVHAHYTLSFQVPKLGFMFPGNGVNTGEWYLADIGLRNAFLGAADTPYYFVTRATVQSKLRLRRKFSHKGNFGKALLIAGSSGKMGACILAARAALRSGLGLLTLHVPQTGNVIVQTAVPEAMTTVDADPHIFTEVNALDSFTVIGIGPGLGKEDATRKAFETVLQSKKPLVLDADALTMLGEHRNLLRLIPPGSILTPHPKEFERMTSRWSNDFERLELQRRLALETNTVVVLKGAHTSIALPGGTVFFNSTGNAGMAKGGSGDVLTGILTGLLAQGYTAEDAAVAGVYLHGLAGDLCAEEKGQNSMIASDLIDTLPEAFKKTQAGTQ